MRSFYPLWRRSKVDLLRKKRFSKKKIFNKKFYNQSKYLTSFDPNPLLTDSYLTLKHKEKMIMIENQEKIVGIGFDNIMQSTLVTFPRGDVQGKANIIAAYEKENQILFFTDKTPFHPVDCFWPDQPSDKGCVFVEGEEYEIPFCLTAAYDIEKKLLFVGDEIKQNKIRRNSSGFVWLVAHSISIDTLNLQQLNVETLINKEITLIVDEKYRDSLSRGHSLCHLASLVLNKVLQNEGLWKKDSVTDSLGNKDFDTQAIISSLISPNSSLDEYRVNTKLKKTFNLPSFLLKVPEIQERVEGELNTLLQEGIEAKIEPEESPLDEKRNWIAKIPGQEKPASILCGGSHTLFFKLKENEQIKTQLNMDEKEGSQFKMVNEITQSPF